MEYVKVLNDDENPQKFKVFVDKNVEKMNKRKEDKSRRTMRPLIAIAFFIANNNLAISRYKSLRGKLLPHIIKEIIIIFYETVNATIMNH